MVEYSEIVPGTVVDYAALSTVHPQHQGIYTRDGIAQSVIFDLSDSSKYPDRWIVHNEVLEFVGQGRPETGDQAWNRYNMGMRKAMNHGRRVHVFERLGGRPARYMYYGRWYVTSIGESLLKKTHQRVFLFRLQRRRGDSEPITTLPILDLESGPDDLREPPVRVEVKTFRVLRDTGVTTRLKNRYAFSCQLCERRQMIGAGKFYAEAHHIRPLGNPHCGPDTPDNIIILCPKHHVDFDYGVVAIDPSGSGRIIHRYDKDLDGRYAYFRKGHRISPSHLRHHLNHIYAGD
ncbi:MAG: HNH endonuclease [Candidatus Thorarchaeota archaeon]|jgi:hypothetical protein